MRKHIKTAEDSLKKIGHFLIYYYKNPIRNQKYKNLKLFLINLSNLLLRTKILFSLQIKYNIKEQEFFHELELIVEKQEKQEIDFTKKNCLIYKHYAVNSPDYIDDDDDNLERLAVVNYRKLYKYSLLLIIGCLFFFKRVQEKDKIIFFARFKRIITQDIYILHKLSEFFEILKNF